MVGRGSRIMTNGNALVGEPEGAAGRAPVSESEEVSGDTRGEDGQAVAPVRRVAQHCDVADRDVQHDAASPAGEDAWGDRLQNAGAADSMRCRPLRRWVVAQHVSDESGGHLSLGPRSRPESAATPQVWAEPCCQARLVATTPRHADDLELAWTRLRRAVRAVSAVVGHHFVMAGRQRIGRRRA